VIGLLIAIAQQPEMFFRAAEMMLGRAPHQNRYRDARSRPGA
jgi:hypothetical protein